MKLSLGACALVALSMLTAASARAAPAVSTADVNMRTGPGVEFPSVGVIPEGAPVDVQGCLNDESWCDVIWEGNRGWVFGEYLGFEYNGATALLPDVGLSVFGIPAIVFNAREYWDRYYVGRPWYRERDRWVEFRYHPRAGWRAPPPGPRKAGWWREGYRAPPGMKPPPERWERHGR